MMTILNQACNCSLGNFNYLSLDDFEYGYIVLHKKENNEIILKGFVLFNHISYHSSIKINCLCFSPLYKNISSILLNSIYDFSTLHLIRKIEKLFSITVNKY